MKLYLYIFGALTLAIGTPAGAADKWSVHEWGTFTSLQDEAGNAIGGINTDDEPVPSFVHRLNGLLSPSEVPGIFFKGAPSCHHDVTMRLETPVIYFHPPKSASGIQTVSVRVAFHGGWLSEFYPDANLTVPGLENGAFNFGPLRSTTESTLEWNNLKIGGDWPVTSTSWHVWTSPRAVQSAMIQATNGESEKFLFYRGVAHINAPLRVSRDAQTGDLLFQSQVGDLRTSEPLPVSALWLVDIEPGEKIAFRTLTPFPLDSSSSKYLARTPANFSPSDYNSGNLKKLNHALHSALVAEGLFDDEAQALLNTWELSYFKSTGLRVFFLVPRAWTDFYLPLQFSEPADIHRVMVGRIELVTPRQRNLLQEFSRFSTNEIRGDMTQLLTNFYSLYGLGTTNVASRRDLERLTQDRDQIISGQKSLSGYVAIPETYQTYLGLGRFRNALVLDEANARPSAGLTNFIAAYRLEGYPPKVVPSGL